MNALILIVALFAQPDMAADLKEAGLRDRQADKIAELTGAWIERIEKRIDRKFHESEQVTRQMVADQIAEAQIMPEQKPAPFWAVAVVFAASAALCTFVLCILNARPHPRRP